MPHVVTVDDLVGFRKGEPDAVRAVYRDYAGLVFAVVYSATHVVLEHVRGITDGTPEGARLAVPVLALVASLLWPLSRRGLTRRPHPVRAR